jgi:hypothetical protein
VLIDGKEYTANTYGLKKWLALEDAKAELFKAIESKSNFATEMQICLSIAFDVPKDGLVDLPWHEVAEEFSIINELNKLEIQFPLLKEQPKKEQMPWEYEGRTWYLWANLLAKSYGWTLDYIAELPPTDAIALLQEVLTDDQLEKEWQWGMSEIAYQYNENTKKSEFKPLTRPVWMQKEIRKPVKMVRLPANMIPVGIIRHGDGSVSNEDTKPA